MQMPSSESAQEEKETNSLRGFLFMKRFLIILCSLMFFPSVSHADSMYVTEIMSVTMRTGPGTQNKIIAILNSGEKLDVIEKGEGWSQVRLSDGKEGWVLTRYLTTQTPTRPLLENLEKKHEKLMEKFRVSDEENTGLKMENKELKSKLKETTEKLENMTAQYENLKTESAEFIAVKKKLAENSTTLRNVKDNEKKLEKMVVKLRNNQILKGIMLGAGILLLGILLGSISKRQKRRSSLL